MKGGDGSIYKINSVTGAATLFIAITNGSELDNILAFDSTDKLFSVDRFGGDSNLWTIDLSTGLGTLIGPTGIPRLGALAFSSEAVPEPASLTLWGLGALGCAVAGYCRRKLAA